MVWFEAGIRLCWQSHVKFTPPANIKEQGQGQDFFCVKVIPSGLKLMIRYWVTSSESGNHKCEWRKKANCWLLQVRGHMHKTWGGYFCPRTSQLLWLNFCAKLVRCPCKIDPSHLKKQSHCNLKTCSSAKLAKRWRGNQYNLNLLRAATGEWEDC